MIQMSETVWTLAVQRPRQVKPPAEHSTFLANQDLFSARSTMEVDWLPKK